MNKEIVPTNGNLPFLLMEQADEEQILAEMKGEIIKEFVYSFPQGGKEIVGLSKTGVDNACREASKKGEFFRVIDMPQIQQDGDYINVIVKVGRYTLHPETRQEIMIDSTLGAKRQWKKMKLQDKSIVADPFWFEKALSKAERNAKRKLLPEKLIVELIKEYRKQGKVRVLQTQSKLTTTQASTDFNNDPLTPKEQQLFDRTVKSRYLNDEKRAKLEALSNKGKKEAWHYWLTEGGRDKAIKEEKKAKDESNPNFPIGTEEIKTPSPTRQEIKELAVEKGVVNLNEFCRGTMGKAWDEETYSPKELIELKEKFQKVS